MTIPLFDAHCDTLYRLATVPDAAISGGGHWDLDRVWRLFGPQTQFFALFADSADPAEQKLIGRELTIFQRVCAREAERLQHCRTAAEAREAHAQGKVVAFLSVEGAELLGCSLEGLEWASQNGVRAVNLTWNHANALSGSHMDQPERGLSPRGRHFIRRMRELGMLVDVSHLSEAGFWDVIEWGEGPLIASHSNSKTIFSHTRNLTDAQFTAIMERKGAVGLNAYAAFLGEGRVSGQTLLAHLEQFLSLGGEQTVALGGDWDGCSALPEGYTGVWNWADLYEMLLRRNYPEALVKDLFFNNMMRTVNDVCTM